MVLATIIIAGCSTVKKSTTSTAPTAPASTPAVIPSSDAYLFGKSTDGINMPGNEELAAIQVQYKEVTLDKLREGYMIYTQGACTNCHQPESIYKFGELQWKDIIEDMAARTQISDAQKDAVYKYVLAMKATQPK
ncbi:MAG: hypothetical protein JWO44_2334 [Bacteroidetes bacterium]|nr:hypothetical protein [Bacteroidota bacterium]